MKTCACTRGDVRLHKICLHEEVCLNTNHNSKFQGQVGGIGNTSAEEIRGMKQHAELMQAGM
eukprot:1158379-Pelagomonas_calceolata.AAC.6